jgi:transposase
LTPPLRPVRWRPVSGRLSERGPGVIVIGIDPHKQTHTAVAVDGATGALAGERTVAARQAGQEQLVEWARALGVERRWALEDCRHVSGSLERLLLGRGERVVRVAPRLMGQARRSGHERGKSDSVDALAVARAALREPGLPVAQRAGPEREIRLLHDHRADLVAERTRIQNRLRWHLHELDPELEVAAGALDRRVWLDRIGRRLARVEQAAQARIARDLVGRCRELARRIGELDRELDQLLRAEAGELLELVGCGPLTAAQLLGEIADVERFATDAKLATHSGAAPLPASSGQTQRHRLNRSGNRQLNCALHRSAITQARVHQPAREYLARKQAEGKSRREALRCLKRHLARVVFRILKTIAAPRRALPSTLPNAPLTAAGLT